MHNSRQLAFLALRDVHRQGAFTDVALDKWLQKASAGAEPPMPADRRLATEIVYGCVRRQRTLDALIDQLATKKADRQPPDLRTILHIGLYQLRYLTQIPAAAAVDTTVQLAKQNSLTGLSGFVNGLLRQYLRLLQDEAGTEDSSFQNDPLQLPADPLQRLGVLHSYPDWMIQSWLDRLGFAETEQLCEWFNTSPTIDLRVNILRSSIEEVEAALQSAGVPISRVPHLPQALRLTSGAGAIQNLPGFSEGWWTVQDSSAQMVSYLLDPQPGEVVIDACAAPGGKTTHIAELMGDTGTIWACDRANSRLKKVKENAERIGLKSIQICAGDSRNFPQFTHSANRVLLDAPCSGLGTLHRRTDARWRQTPENIQELSQLQGQLLEQVAGWVKTGGVLVYATCTVHPLENEQVIETFLGRHSNWNIELPAANFPVPPTPEGWVKVWPHRYQMDGFFMVRLKREKD